MLCLTSFIFYLILAPFIFYPAQLYGHGLGESTLVKVRHGARSIEEISTGVSKNKKIISYKLSKNRCSTGYIRSAGKSETNCYMRISFNTYANVNKTCDTDILCTPAQEFYVREQNRWVPAYQLKASHKLLSASTELKTVTNIEFIKQPLIVYVLEVEKHHNFFVGKHFVLTHNTALPWQCSLIFSIPFGAGGGAAAGGQAGSYLGPVGIVGGIIIGGVLGWAAEKYVNQDQLHHYAAIFDVDVINAYLKGNNNSQQSNNPIEVNDSELPKDPNNKKKPDWTPHRYKHFPKRNVSWNDILKSTKHGDAKYKPDVDIEKLERMAWDKGRPVTNGKPWKVFEAEEIIGAKRGIETPYMRVEINSNTIHGHPITPAEYVQLLK